MRKKTGLIAGTMLGALAGAFTYVTLKQRTGDPFDTVNDIRNKYAEKTDLETTIEADNMTSEGAMTTVNYVNKRQEKA